MRDTRLTHLLHSADPNSGIMLVGCQFKTDDEDVTHLVDELSPLYVAPPKTKEILRLFETSSDINLSGYANTDDNRKVFILSVRAGILKSLIRANTNFETINAWLEKSDEMIRTVDVYIQF